MTARSHEAFAELVAAYALGALDPAERRDFEAHLATCVTCQHELAEMRRVTAGLGMAADPVAPPESLKARTIAKATSQPQARGAHAGTPATPVTPSPSARFASKPRISASWLATAASLAIAAGAGIYAWSLRVQIENMQQTVTELSTRANDLRGELDRARRESARLSHVIDIVQAPTTIQVSLTGTAAARDAVGRASFNPGKGMVVSAENLPALAPGRTYQLWVIVGAANPVGAGLFTVANGAATVTATLPPNLSVSAGAPVTIAVTDEPAGGSNQPSTPPILAGQARTKS